MSLGCATDDAGTTFAMLGAASSSWPVPPLLLVANAQGQNCKDQDGSRWIYIFSFFFV